MNHAQLRAFHAVALHGSFTRAAEAVRLTQPTLSGQVKALEDHYGVRLFDRRGRNVELTGLGAALLGVARQIFGLEGDAEQLLAAARGLTGGQLRIGADAPYHVVSHVAAFSRRHPNIRMTLTFGNSERVLQDLFDRRTDIAVLPELAHDDRLHRLALHSDHLVVFVDRGHPWARRRSIRLEEIAGQCLIQREPGSTTRAIFELALAEAGIAPSSVLDIGSREAVREAVAAGLGIGVVSRNEFGRDDRVHYVTVRDARLRTTEYAACLAARRDTPVIGAFFELLEEEAG
jgi:aminoethylphosphonate catabolism LysR family transcriptional regulator